MSMARRLILALVPTVVLAALLTAAAFFAGYPLDAERSRVLREESLSVDRVLMAQEVALVPGDATAHPCVEVVLICGDEQVVVLRCSGSAVVGLDWEGRRDLLILVEGDSECLDSVWCIGQDCRVGHESVRLRIEQVLTAGASH